LLYSQWGDIRRNVQISFNDYNEVKYEFSYLSVSGKQCEKLDDSNDHNREILANILGVVAEPGHK
jgi:hypothetical protein